MKLRIRKRKRNGRLLVDYVVDLGILPGEDGTRRRRRHFFTTKEEAAAYLETKRELREQHGVSALALRPGTALRYEDCERRLAMAGASIEQATDFFLEHHRPVRERISLGELLDRCVLDLELRKVGRNTISTFACACRSFLATRGDRELATIRRDEIRGWIYGNGWEPKTQRGYLGALAQLFAWAVTEGYLAQSPLKTDVSTGKRKSPIQLPKLVRKEPAIFTVAQVEQLFAAALNVKSAGVNAAGKVEPMRIYRRLIGFLALATFAGIRPFELTRLEAVAIDLDAKIVPLDAKVTKTADRRIVELSDNCVAWLKLWRSEFPKHPHAAPPSWDRLMKELRVKAKLTPWPHDCLRHCFASYFHAQHGDKAKLQNQMGHSQSEDTLDKHYRAVRGPDGRPVTKDAARKFWAICPP